MATQAPSTLDNLMSLLGSLKETKQTTTSTKSSGVSQEGIQQLLNSILAGNQGLAAIASGQKTSGLYNSTVNQQLTNDLLTRAAAEAQKAGAGETTTVTTSTPAKVSKGTAGTALLLGAGKSLLGPTISAGLSRAGIGGPKDIAESLRDFIFEDSASTSAGLAADAFSTIGSDISSSVFAGAAEQGIQAFDLIGNNYTDVLSSLVTDFGSNLATDIGSDVATEVGGDFFSSLF